MFNVKRCRYKILPLAVVLLLLLGTFGCGPSESEEEIPNGEEEVEETKEEVEKAETPTNGEKEVKETKEEAEIEEDNPYDEAEEIAPMEDRTITMDEEFKSVLEEVFEKEPKLVSTSGIEPLNYVVDRVITTDDVSKIKDLLEEKGYETVDTRAEGNEYEFDISISEEVLEEKYDGDVGGNMYVVIWTAEEGEEAQKIYVRTL